MKAIDFKHAQISTVTSRVDGSVKFAVVTPELEIQHRAVLLGMHGKNARVMIEPLDVPIDGLEEVSTEAEPKTPCARLRACIFVFWEQSGKPDSFDTFYRSKMERLITYVKDKLE